MATRARFESPSPVSSISKPLESITTTTTTTDAISSSHFHTQYPQFHQNSHRESPIVLAAPVEDLYYDPRFSSGRYHGARKPQVPDLPILSYHNAVPDHCRSSAPAGLPVPVVLPLVGPGLGPSTGQYSSSSPRAQQGYGDAADTSFGYTPQKHQNAHGEGKQRSLSIQSLISSPGLDQPMTYSGETQTRKRKGSDDADDGARGTRHASLVPTSVSIEDPDVREVVEALGGLKGDFAPAAAPSPSLPQSHHVQPEHEPLLNLITHRAHPLLSSAITTSLSAYGASKSYSASFRYAAESVENRVGLPVSNVVSAVGRRTGLEGVLRRGLQRSSSIPSAAAQHRPDYSKKRKTRSDADKKGDADAARKVLIQQQQQQRESDTLEVEGQTWQKRLMLSTSGLGVALNDESLKNLKYCLQWLRFLNVHLSKLVTALRSVVEELDNHQQQQQQQVQQNAVEGEGTFGRLLPASCEQRRVQLAARVEGLKAEVVGTMKKVVEVVSNYTGSALPDNARDLIKRHIFSLPQRFAAASASPPPTSQLVPSSPQDEDANSPRSSANRVLVLAKEGLDMMQQVSAVVEGTIVRAEEWCERLGKKKHEEEEGPEAEMEDGPEKKRISWKKRFEGLEERRRDAEGDVIMSGRLRN